MAKAISNSLEGLRAPDRGSTHAGQNKADQLNSLKCPFPEICTADDKTDCLRNRVTYELVCGVCQGEEEGDVPEVAIGRGSRAVYRGQTGHSLHKRLLEHAADVRRASLHNGMARHMQTVHPHVDRTAPNDLFTAKIIGARTLNLERTLLEALQIEEAESDSKLEVCNSRSEWGRGQLRRLTVVDREARE